MAKPKPDAKGHTKKTISTSAMFKKIGRKTGNEAVPSKIEKASKAIKSIKASKKQHKVKQRAEHPLAAAFSDTIEASRETLLDQANADIDCVRLELEQRLSKSDDYYTQLHKDSVLFNQTLALPFKNEELKWTSLDGKQSGSTTLGVRMKRLEKTIEAEEKELNLQQADWSAVQMEILTLVSEMVGLAGLDQWLAGNLDTNTFVNGAFKKAELEVAAEKEKFVAEIEKLEKDSLKKMKDSEKKLQLQQKDIEKQFANILSDED